MKDNVLLQGILNASPNAMTVYQAVYNSQGLITDMRLMLLTPLSAQFIGAPTDQLAGRLLSELTAQYLITERYEWLKEVNETGVPFEQEIYVHLPDGSSRWMNLIIQRVDTYLLITYDNLDHHPEAESQVIRQNTLLQSIFATSLLGIIVHRAVRNSTGKIIDFQVIEANDASLKMIGTTTSIRGNTLKQHYPETETHGLFNQFVKVCETGASFETEQYYPHIARWYVLMGVPLGDGLVITYQDITDRKLAELAHQQQADLLTRISDTVQIGVVIYEPVRNGDGQIFDFRYKYFNKQAKERLPLDWQDVINKSMRLMNFSENIDQVINQMAQVMETDTPYRSDLVLPDGRVLAISLSKFGEDIVSSSADVTQIRQAQEQARYNSELEKQVADRTQALRLTLEQLKQSKDDLASALAAERELGELKSRFVSMASHEFRTPLTSIATSAVLAGKYTDADQQDKRKKHHDRIIASVHHLNSILEEFLSVSRLEEGKVRVQPTEFDLTELVRESITDIQGMLKPAQTVQLEMSCRLPLFLDVSLLRKILLNLLSNAVKYSGQGSVVTIQGHCAGDQLTLSVQDQGMGISKEDQAHLFERFFRASNVSNISGTGLGLHIVGRYVELMGGKVSLQSKLNHGTTVTLTLPLSVGNSTSV
ncbi:ATP-binding protein [Spirosoma sp. KNUC1025]|uniref:sensor histidine kinase n=1 Tax=Spirosoma sp. KNUC1025 TaxID=2894082 RepID=UPI00386A71EC|nr:PAS domain-containing protein [Spirosoma sp. KNUC1025]